MARLVVSVAPFFFFFFIFFALPYASRQLAHPKSDVAGRDLTNSLEKSDTNPTIRLPGEKTESEPEATDSKPLHADTQIMEPTEHLPGSETETADRNEFPLTRTVTVVTFRPVNRHFQSKHPFALRFSRHGCRHGLKLKNYRLPGRELSYGNDMILSGASSDFEPPMFRGGVRQINGRWIRYPHQHHYHHHHDAMRTYPFKHHEMLEKESFKRPYHHEEEKEEKRSQEREQGGFVKRIRKFLTHF